MGLFESAGIVNAGDIIPKVDLEEQVQNLLFQIPYGKVATYGDLARALGDEKTRSARWLGEYLHHHVHTDDCPCHRVVRSNGEIGLHVSDDAQLKAELLRDEGVPVSATGVVDLSFRTTDLVSDLPLEQLRLYQHALAADVKRPAQAIRAPQTIAGVDVAYLPDGRACGAYVCLDATSLQVLHEITLTMPVQFPYIPGYLTFRELPVLCEMCRLARENEAFADVIFCDGNGELHPWRAGIATCLGVLLDHPVIGIGKSLLCGRVTGPPNENHVQPIELDGDMIANSMRRTATSKPIYVSAGNRINLKQATMLTLQAFGSHRVPEPIFLADKLSKQIKKMRLADPGK